jgi:hypothetical protein
MMRMDEVDFEKGKRAYTMRDKVGPEFADEVKKVAFPSNHIAKDIADDLFEHLHVHNNFLCGAAGYVKFKFKGDILKKVFKYQGELYFVVSSEQNPFQEYFFKNAK